MAALDHAYGVDAFQRCFVRSQRLEASTRIGDALQRRVVAFDAIVSPLSIHVDDFFSRKAKGVHFADDTRIGWSFIRGD